jgi:thiol:disulfide interchange protein DsbC
VVVGKKIAYTDRSGRYFMYGSLVDMQTKDDLTAARREELARIDVKKLPIADAIVRVNGKGRRAIYVFSDPDCPFCRRLEPELDKLDDVTVYIFLYPIESLHSDAARKAQSIWCQADERGRPDLWHRVVMRTETIATTECDNPLKRNLALGESLGVLGTPTLVAADGRTLPGMAEAAVIDDWLNHRKTMALAPATN